MAVDITLAVTIQKHIPKRRYVDGESIGQMTDDSRINKTGGKNDVLTRLFFKLLPVQIMIVAMGAINSIVDGTVAGRCIDAGSVGVVGLSYSFVNLINATSSVLLGGSSVLCGRAMGSGDVKKTNVVYSLDMTLSLLFGVLFTVFGAAFPRVIADILGASSELRGNLIIYLMGYSIGIIPLILSQQTAAFLQMERQNKLGYIGIAGMLITNIVTDIVFVMVFDMGVFGLALATSISNWVYYLILATYYMRGRSQFKLSIRDIDWSLVWPVIKIGFPGAMLMFCLSFRAMIMNRILLKYTGNDGLSAQAALDMIRGLFTSFALGIAATFRMLCSVAYGEEDRDSLKRLVKIAMVKTLPLSLGISVLVLLLSSYLSSIFFPDTASVAYGYCRSLFAVFSFCIPLIVFCCTIADYFQATGHNLYVNILSVFDGLVSTLIPTVILAPLMGALGIWISNPIGMILTLLLSVIYVIIRTKGIPSDADGWMLLSRDFGVRDEDRLALMIEDMDDVVKTSSRVQEFCLGHGMERKRAYYAALGLEEMAGNVVNHGFLGDNKKHIVEVRTIIKEEGVLLRIKDDCIPFDPMEMAQLLSGEDPAKNIGIRMINNIADEMTYQNIIGLNVLSIRFFDNAEPEAADT